VEVITLLWKTQLYENQRDDSVFFLQKSSFYYRTIYLLFLQQRFRKIVLVILADYAFQLGIYIFSSGNESSLRG